MERHGIYTNEAKTSILSTAPTNPTLPVVFGTAPVNLSLREAAPVNEPILCFTYAEAVEALGYSEDWSKYSLCEVMNSHFSLFGQSPVVFINVLDPVSHKTTVAAADTAVTAGTAKVAVAGIIKSSVIVKSSDGATTYVVGTDYTTAFDADGFLIVTRKSTGAIPAGSAQIKIGYDKLNPAGVTATDIIGGVDVATGKLKGLELVQEVFPRFRMIPGLILAPGYSQQPTVAAVMTAKATKINGHFDALALTDIPTDTVTKYTDAPAWKESNNYTSDRQIPCYPMLRLGSNQYHFSTQLAGLICKTDAENGGVPYASPSNHALQVDGAVLKSGTEVLLGPDQANYLNANGISTALNFIGGWKDWGNRTGVYPAVTDPVKAFIPVRRMFDWISNTIVLTYWQKVDDPMNRRLVEAVTDSINIWLNGLQASGFLLGGRVEFRSEDNPATSLMDGKLSFRVYITPPSPAQEISFTIEYDPTYLGSLTE